MRSAMRVRARWIAPFRMCGPGTRIMQTERDERLRICQVEPRSDGTDDSCEGGGAEGLDVRIAAQRR